MEDLTQLATFARVVEAGSMTEAAHHLGVSLSVVSRRIKALETELEATLLLRTTRSLRVTEAGSRYYERVLRVLRDLEEARFEVGQDDVVVGRLIVSAPVTWGLLRLVPRLRALRKAHPGLLVELRLEDRVVDVVGEGVDVALRGGPLPDSHAFVAHVVDVFGRLLAASPDYLGLRGRPRSVQALMSGQHDCLVHAPASTGQPIWDLQTTAGDRTIAPKAGLISNNVQVLRDAAVDGLGVALLPEWMARAEVDAGRLEIVLPGVSAAAVRVSALYHRATRAAPRVRAFVDFLREDRQE